MLKSSPESEATKNKTSLWIISDDSPESYSPTGERVLHLARASASRFDRVMILTLNPGASKEEQPMAKSKISICNIAFLRALPFPLSALFDPVKSLMFIVHGLKLRHLKPTLIVGSMPSLEVGVSALLLSRLLHAELSIDLRDDWESSISVQLTKYIPKQLIKVVCKLAKQVYSCSSILLVATQTIADSILERGIKTKAILIPNGADTRLFNPKDVDTRKRIRLQTSLPIDKTIVVYSGSGMNPYYRLDLVLKSLKLLPLNAAKKLFFLFLVYNGQRSLERLKDQLAIPKDMIQIRSPLPRNRLAKVLSACDVGLVPFDSQSYLLCAKSTKMYEYLSCGLYVVSSGPRDGELDLFFQENPELGSFTLPSSSCFVRVLLQVIEKAEDSLTDCLREFRYDFIKRNFDRQAVMAKASAVLISLATVNNARDTQ